MASVKFAPTNNKLQAVTSAAIDAANDEFIGSFNFESMIDELLKDIPVLGLESETNAAEEA